MTNTWNRIDRINRSRFSSLNTGYLAFFNGSFDSGDEVDVTGLGRTEITYGRSIVVGTSDGAHTVDRIAVMDASTNGNIVDQLTLPTSFDIGADDTVNVVHGLVKVT